MAVVMIDSSGLTKLGSDLARATPQLAVAVRATVSKAAVNMKKTLVDEAAGHPYFPRFPSSISYDITTQASGITAEVGPDKSRPQGALGNLLYFGTAATGPVLPDPALALEHELPTLTEYLAQALASSLSL